MRKKRPIIVWLIAIAALLATAIPVWLVVGRFAGYDKAVASGRSSLPEVREFESLFKDSKHSISHYTGMNGTPTWESKAGFMGRYIVVLQMPIRVDRFGSGVVPLGQPAFHVVEVGQITEKEGGQTEITYTENQRQFSNDLWKRVVETRDLSLIGIDVTNEHEVPGFAKHWPGG